MFEKIDNRIGSQMRRRAVAVVAVGALTLPVAAVIANVSQGPRTEPSIQASNSEAAASEYSNEVDSPATDSSPAGLDGATSEPAPTSEVAPPATDPSDTAPPETAPPETGPTDVNPPETTPPPTTAPETVQPPIEGDLGTTEGDPEISPEEGHTSSVFGGPGSGIDSSVSGNVHVEPTGNGKWRVVADIRGLAPNTNHLVLLQPQYEGGEFHDRIGLCSGMSDDAGVFNCDWANVDMFPGTENSLITVMGGMVEEGYPPVVASGTWDSCDGH